MDSQRPSPSSSASGSTSSIVTRESSQTSLSSGLTPPPSVARDLSNSSQPSTPSAAQSTAQAPSTPSPLTPYSSSTVPQHSSAPSPSRQNLSATSEYDTVASGPSLISPVIGAIGTAARDPHSVMSVGDMLSATELRRRSQGLGPMPPAEIRSMMDMIITHHLRESEEMEERKRKGKNVSGCEKN
jgi:hypothetical protein